MNNPAFHPAKAEQVVGERRLKDLLKKTDRGLFLFQYKNATLELLVLDVKGLKDLSRLPSKRRGSLKAEKE